MDTQKFWLIRGASKGIRLEITKAVLNNGGKVIATSRNTNTLLEKIKNYKENLLPVEFDITEETAVKHTISKGIEEFS